MTSNFPSRRFDIRDYGMVFAGVQKNLGPAGATVVIVDEALVKPNPTMTTIGNYDIQIQKDSLYNTGPTFPIYVVKEVAKFLLDTGGIDAWETMNQEKADMVYNVIDDSNGFYVNEVKPDCRSRLNVPFRVGHNQALETLFLAEAAEWKLVDLAGYGGVGIRASIYNGVPYKGVERLRDFMKWFQVRYQK